MTHAVPTERDGNHGVVVGAGGRSVAIVAGGQAFHSVGGQLAAQHGVVQQGDGFALHGQRQRFDERPLALGGGGEGPHRQAVPLQGFHVDAADAVGLGPDHVRPPAFEDGFQAVALLLPTHLAEAVQGDQAFALHVEDGKGGVVVDAPPVDADGVARLFTAAGGPGGAGQVDVTEDVAGVLDELGQVFLAEPAVGRFQPGLVDLLLRDERAAGGGMVEAPPIRQERVQAHLVEAVEPVETVGRAEEEGAASPVGQGRADRAGPDFLRHEGSLIQHGQVQADAAQVVGVVAAAHLDHAAAGQGQAMAALVFVRPAAVEGGLEVPPDFVGHAIGGRDPPAKTALSGFGQQGRFAQLGLAPAASAGQHAEAGRAVEDFTLGVVQAVLLRLDHLRQIARWIGHAVGFQGLDGGDGILDGGADLVERRALDFFRDGVDQQPDLVPQRGGEGGVVGRRGRPDGQAQGRPGLAVKFGYGLLHGSTSFGR